MTPELGPRVRIAVVTTKLPLAVSPRKRDMTMIDFCTRCKKCADVCLSRSISFANREEPVASPIWLKQPGVKQPKG